MIGTEVKKTMKSRIIFLVVFYIVITIACFVVTAVCAKQYTTTVYYFNTGTKVVDTRFKSENDRVELKDVTIDDTVINATFTAKAMGDDTVTFYTETDNKEDDMAMTLRFRCGPFNTIFDISYLVDFEGSIYIIWLLVFSTAVFAAVLIYSFIDMARKAAFGYTMVACGGIGIFCLHLLTVNIMTLMEAQKINYVYGFGNYVYELTRSGDDFSRNIALGMIVFCLLLIISNLSLIRHEGFRVFNLLGVALGVLWFVGFALNSFFMEQALISDFEVFTPLSNGISVIISYFECMLFSTAVAAFLSSRNQPPLDRDYIVILGCSIRQDGSLTPILRGRVDAAIRFAEKQVKETGKQPKFVPSGGQGADEVISEGEAMKRYLVEQGVDEKYILPETRSVNTLENIKLSKRVIESDTQDDYNAAFATTNYHVFRGYTLSEKLGLKNARGISSKTKWYFFPNAFLRELVGLIVEKWKLHLLVILTIIESYTLIFFIIL